MMNTRLKHLSRIGCYLILTSTSSEIQSQDTSIQRGIISYKAFIETFYSYSFNQPGNHRKADFVYNHNRHNEMNINLALINFSYKRENLRSNLGLMFGTYPEDNLAAEQELLKHFYEINIGVRVSRKDLWIDAGVFPSHIGLETAISKDCWTVTRSIAAENSPYYESGIKISYKSDNTKWFLSGMLLNGWQRIKRPEANNTPAFGTQLTFIPSENTTLNFSSFIGNDYPDSLKKWRYFSNTFGTFYFSKTFGLSVSFDSGIEQKFKNSNEYNFWCSPFLIARFQKGKWAYAGRVEYYSDKNGVIIKRINSQPFQLHGISINVDRNLGPDIVLRIEGKLLHTTYPYFQHNNRPTKDEFSVTSSISIGL